MFAALYLLPCNLERKMYARYRYLSLFPHLMKTKVNIDCKLKGKADLVSDPYLALKKKKLTANKLCS